MNDIFSSSCFVGYINAVQPQYLSIHFPSAKLLRKFRWQGKNYAGAEVNKYVLIESDTNGYLARIVELNLPDSERKELNESAVQNSDTNFHPSGRAEILLSFDTRTPDHVGKTISNYPGIGSKVYACSDELIGRYVSRLGDIGADGNAPQFKLAHVLSTNVDCYVSANSLLNRHCAVLGTTGGGKSWTLARIMEQFAQTTCSKMVLIDATGEFASLENHSLVKSVVFGKDTFIPPSSLSNNEICYFLKESSPNTVATLCNAVDSLRIMGLPGVDFNGEKQGKSVAQIENLIYSHYSEIQGGDFDFKKLPIQIRRECVKEQGGKFVDDPFRLSYCSHLISRVNLIVNNESYARVFGFESTHDINDIFAFVDGFIVSDEEQSILRIDFSHISFDFNLREVVVDLLASHLMKCARRNLFKKTPFILCIDEAHQFLNKSSITDNGERLFMNGVSNIAKEGRKYGLFLCLATQMPRDIPIDILSQMGSFIVHRLTNDADKKSVESACSFAGKSVLGYMPVLGAGEAILCGAEFSMPLLLSIIPPVNKPNSNTPSFAIKSAGSNS